MSCAFSGLLKVPAGAPRVHPCRTFWATVVQGLQSSILPRLLAFSVEGQASRSFATVLHIDCTLSLDCFGCGLPKSSSGICRKPYSAFYCLFISSACPPHPSRSGRRARKSWGVRDRGRSSSGRYPLSLMLKRLEPIL